MKQAFGEFHKYHEMTINVRFCLSYGCFKLDFNIGYYFNRKRNVVTNIVMTLHVHAKKLPNVWSYDFYDSMLSTE